MVVIALVFAALAAAVHLYIFWLESIAWTRPRARRIFGIRSDEEARITRPLALNQGFYNLFLALMALGGIVAIVVGAESVGATLVFAGAGSMVAAGIVLLVSSPSKARAAFVQLTFPLLAVVCLAIGLLI